jgi:hypothetical protein
MPDEPATLGGLMSAPRLNLLSDDQKLDASFHLTEHARGRIRKRGLSEEAVALTIQFGRLVFARGAQIFAIGRREVRRVLEEQGVDLSWYEGVQVVCSLEGSILTTYRNRDFRSLRPLYGRKSRRSTRRGRRASAAWRGAHRAWRSASIGARGAA